MNDLIMRLAIALLPPSRKAWGEAMLTEYALLEDGQNGFAFGCLWASLKENVTTGEGWARVGFLIPLFFSVLLAKSLFLSLLMVHTADAGAEDTRFIGALMLLVACLTPIVMAEACVRAMAAPTDRLHLAKTGFKVVSRLVFVFSAFFYAATVGGLMMLLMTKPTANIGWVYSASGAFFGGVYYLLGQLAQTNAKSMRKAGLIGLALFLVPLGILFATSNTALALNLLPVGIMLSLLHIALAAAGSLFFWMQRPEKVSS